jgi:hypothetical protein
VSDQDLVPDDAPWCDGCGANHAGRCYCFSCQRWPGIGGCSCDREYPEVREEMHEEDIPW